jgi:hypothetical protein
VYKIFFGWANHLNPICHNAFYIQYEYTMIVSLRDLLYTNGSDIYSKCVNVKSIEIEYYSYMKGGREWWNRAATNQRNLWPFISISLRIVSLFGTLDKKNKYCWNSAITNSQGVYR